MQYRHEIEHAPANFAFVAVLTSSFALLAFSKYWRAQITPIIDPYSIIRFTYWFLQFFTSPNFAISGLRLPLIQTYIAENFFIILLFHSAIIFFLKKRAEKTEREMKLFFLIFRLFLDRIIRFILSGYKNSSSFISSFLSSSGFVWMRFRQLCWRSR